MGIHTMNLAGFDDCQVFLLQMVFFAFNSEIRFAV